MHIKLTLILATLFMACLGQAQKSPAQVILPQDVVQDSIQLIEFSTPSNVFAVTWTYTEAGAEKALAAWEASGSHYGLTPEFKKSWLKHRTDKKFFRDKPAAQALVSGLRTK